MTIEIYLIILMFSVTLTAYVSALNARTTPKAVVSHIFASLVLLGAVFSLFNYVILQKEEKNAERERYEEQLKKAEEEARLAAEAAALEGTAKTFNEVITKGSSIARTILSVDVDNEDIDYDVLVRRSAGLRSQAYALKRDLDGVKLGDQDKKFEDTHKLITKAMKNLTVAGNYFNLYFKSEDEDEEDERFDIYRANAASSRNNFSRAADKLKNVSD